MSRSDLRILAFVFTICFFTVPFVSAADVSFSYDANGNLINGDGLSYVYDDGNHLTEVRLASNNSLIAQYLYDDAGNRVKKVSGGVTTYYIGNYLETRVQGTQQNDTSYYFANAERVARKDPDGSKYYNHGDNLGSTSIVTNVSGAVVESVAYLPYGETQSKTGSGSTYLYTDQELDPESGLYYYGARYYSPKMMRFVEPDPVIQNIFNPQNLNRYSYVLNNPMIYTDPLGSDVVCVYSVKYIVYKEGELYCEDQDTHEYIKATVKGWTPGAGIIKSAFTQRDMPKNGDWIVKGGVSFESPVSYKVGLGLSGNGKDINDVPATVGIGVNLYGLFSSSTEVMAKLNNNNRFTGSAGLELWLGGQIEQVNVYEYGSNTPTAQTISSPSSSSSDVKSSGGNFPVVQQSSANFMNPPSSSSQTCSAYNGYSSSQVFGDTTKSLTNSVKAKPQYGYNPHKYPWDSSGLRGWD